MSSPLQPATSAALQRTKSAPLKPKISAPSRPRTPYISLDDEHTKSFFTKTRLQNHLRRAGLLNKNGEILTQAEYESIQTDVAIGRENRRKIDDTIMEVLNDMAREHWAHVHKYTEKLEKDLLYQFGRIQEQFRRRVQPVIIRRGFDGRIQLDTIEPIKDNHSDVSENSVRSSTNTLPLVRPVNSHPRPQSSHSSTARRPTNIDNILQEFNNVKHRLTNLEKLLNTDSRKTESDGNFQKFDQVLGNLQGQQIIIQELKILKEKINEENQRIDELDRQSKLHNDQPGSSNIDKQQIENFIQTSTVIKELRDRSLILETSFRNLSTGLTQEAIDQAIRISEKKAIDREQIIENLARGTDDKIKLMETQLAQLLARLEKLPSSITYADAHQLIQNEIQNFIQTQPDNNEWQNLAREAIYKVNYLENQLNDFFQSTKDNSPRPIVTEPVERPILIQKPVTKANDNFEQRLNDLERRLNNIPSPPNLGLIEQRLTQLEKYPPNRNDQRIATLEDQIRDISGHLQSIQKQIDDLDKRKLERGEIPPRHDDIEQRLQQQLQNLSDTVMGHLKTKPDHQMVNRLIQDSEERINQQLNALQQLVTENQHALKNMKNYLNDLYQQLNQQLPKIPKLPDKLKPEEDPVIHKPTLEELQTIMPFIELLPTFDMLNENEWI